MKYDGEQWHDLAQDWNGERTACRAPDSSTRGWTVEEFTIDNRQSKIVNFPTRTVEGYTRGLMGIDKRGENRWVITHLPTGLRIASVGYLRTAKRLASRFEQYMSDDGLAYNDSGKRVLENWKLFDAFLGP